MGIQEGIDWDLLLRRIADGKCTPFLGAGACYGYIPLGGALAADMAERYGYPLDDSNNLSKVAQFVSIIKNDYVFAKDEVISKLKNVAPPDFENPEEVHGLLADLPLPIYITTNYDDFMFQALKRKEGRNPIKEFCRWNSYLEEFQATTDGDYKPTIDRPLIFHFHGHQGVPESIVLTEDDYLDFLISISKDQQVIPRDIQKTFAGTSLLFLGYSLADMSFRIVFRSIVTYLTKSLKRSHVSVQLVPVGKDASPEQRKAVKEYLNKYFSELDIVVYWGTCAQFTKELRKRWEKFSNGH